MPQEARMTLTKARIVKSIQNELDIPKDQSADVFETLIELIKSALESGEDVLI